MIVQFKINIYPDGSIRINVIELPEENNNLLRAIDTGSWETGTGYRTCRGAKVKDSVGIVTVSFYADFTLVQNSSDYISSVYDYSINTFFGDYQVEYFGIVRRNEAYDPAEAKLQFKFTGYTGVGAKTCWIKLFVGNDDYYSDSHIIT
ncbi:MAG: DUF5626 family protein [Clostridium argentinense]|nr:DUF5626 family protein [Clostridium argentinense]